MKISRPESGKGVAVRMLILFIIELAIAGLMVFGYYEVRFILPKEPEETEKIELNFGGNTDMTFAPFTTEATIAEATTEETTVVTTEETTEEPQAVETIIIETVQEDTSEEDTTAEDTTEETTEEPTTPEPTTPEPTTPEPTTPEPTTPEPTTPEPTTPAPTQPAAPAGNSYADGNISVQVNQYSYGEGNDKVTYYVADINVADIRYFGSGLNGNSIWQSSMIYNYAAQNPQFVLVANGDNAGYHDQGLVVRNGVIYRNALTNSDQCVLFANGEMKTYGPNQFTADDAQKYGAWQCWCFGPALLDDGVAKTTFNCAEYIAGTHPRTAIGYYSPGHYCVVVVDGRNAGHSRGVPIGELAILMQNLGCKVAYNLDGGYSSAMCMNGALSNVLVRDGRQDTDYIIVSTVPLA